MMVSANTAGVVGMDGLHKAAASSYLAHLPSHLHSFPKNNQDITNAQHSKLKPTYSVAGISP